MLAANSITFVVVNFIVFPYLSLVLLLKYSLMTNRLILFSILSSIIIYARAFYLKLNLFTAFKHVKGKM